MVKTSRKEVANQYFQVLNNLSLLVSQSLSLDTVLYSSLDKTLEIMNKQIGGILLLDDESQELRYAAYRGLSSEYVQKMYMPLGEGIAGRVAQDGKAIVSEDMMADPRVVFPNLILSEGLRAFASIPLISKGKVLGVINIASRKRSQFSAREIQLLNSIAAQVAVAVENAKLHQEVQKQDAIKGELLREIFSIQEEERKRIARELHDDTSQVILSLILSLEATVAILPANPDEAVSRLKKIQAQLDGILDGIYRIIYELRPSILDDLGLVAAVRWLVENNAKKAGINIQLNTEGQIKRLPQVETTIFRVIQEALSNIIKHSLCQNAWINLNFQKDNIAVHIEDDGKGFDINEAINSPERPRGLGLIGMRERVELMKGTLNIDSKLNGGTRIDIRI